MVFSKKKCYFSPPILLEDEPFYVFVDEHVFSRYGGPTSELFALVHSRRAERLESKFMKVFASHLGAIWESFGSHS